MASPPKSPKILPHQIRKVVKYSELPGQTYRSPDCKTYYWREDDHSEFTLLKRQCQCADHPMLLSLDETDTWYEVKNELVPELVWITEAKDVPLGIYRAKGSRVMTRPEPNKAFQEVEFQPYQTFDGNALVLGTGIPSKEVVARVDGKLYRIPYEMIPKGGN